MDEREQLLERVERVQLLQKVKAVQAAKTQKPPDAPAEDNSQAPMAALQGYGQGASFGYLPQLQAATEPAMAKMYDMATGNNISDTLPDYAARRDEKIAAIDKLKESNPKSFVAAQLAGGLTTGLAVPGAALGKGASLAAKVGASVASGAAFRGLQNPGDTPGVVDPLQLSERGENIANPTALAIDTAVPLAGPALSKAGEWLGNKAEKAAFSSIGPYKRSSEILAAKDKINPIGRTLLDEGVIGYYPKKYATLLERLQGKESQAGKDLGDVVEGMAAKETGPKVSLSRSDIAKKLEGELISPQTDAAGVIDRNAKMQAYLENFRRDGMGKVEGPVDDAIPLLNAEMKKRAVAKEVNWNRLPGADIPDSELFNRALNSNLREGVERGGEELAQKTGFDVNQFKGLKEKYGNLSEAGKILQKKNAAEIANRMISPSDYGAGAVGATIGAMSGGSPEERLKHATMGAALGLLNHGARKYGNQVSAMSLNNLSKAANYASPVMDTLARNPVATTAVTNQPNVWNTLFTKSKKENGK